VKHLSLRWLAVALFAPVLTVVGTLLLIGSHSHAASSGAKGVVQVAFTGTLTTADGAPIAQESQRVLLNVIAVRLHPSSDLTVSDFDSRWVTIPAPANTGKSNPELFITTSLNFGGGIGGGGLLASPVSVLQLDLIALQNLPFFFNGATIPAQTYQQIELTLNPTTPGNVVPLCAVPRTRPAGEGCVPYGVTLSQAKTKLRIAFGPFELTPNTVEPLLVNLGVIVGPGPSANPDTTTVSITPVITGCGGGSNPCSSTVNGVPFNPQLGLVMGNIAHFDPKKTTVTAEFSGTNQIVASTKLMRDGSFSLSLPALPIPNSTLYDFYVSGNGGYIVRSRVPVASLGASSGSPPVTFLGTPAHPLSITSSTFNSIAGVVRDACVAGAPPIEAATLQLLVPDTSKGGATCKLTGGAIPSNCVVVGTATTDDQGVYPLPSDNAVPQPFDRVPVILPDGVGRYDLEISASGYNTTVQEVARGPARRLTCPTSGAEANRCTFALEHGYLAGEVLLSRNNDSGFPLDVMISAEDSGTSHIENFALAHVPAGRSDGSFRMLVPDAAPSSSGSVPVTDYDVFGLVQDVFGPSPQKVPGHSIETAGSVGAPAACATISVRSLDRFDCAGQGSVSGTVIGANPTTTSVTLSKGNVQIGETEPNSIGFDSSGNNLYNFCAPADTYDLTRNQSGNPAAAPAEITLTNPTTTPTPSPTASSTPCTGICGASAGSCRVCQTTTGPTL